METLYRKGLGGKQPLEEYRAFLQSAADQRVAEATGAAVAYTAGAPIALTGNAIGDEFYVISTEPHGVKSHRPMLPQKQVRCRQS